MNAGQSIPAPRDVVEELERSQARWALLDVLLRRLATRLTYAADGRSAELDETLGELRRQLREPLEESALESLLTGLTNAVRSLDAPPREPAITPAPPAPAVVSTPATPLWLIVLPLTVMEEPVP